MKAGKIVAVFLCVAVALGVFTAQSNKAEATGGKLITDSIRDKQNQISQAEKERENLETNLTDLQALKKELETKKKDLSGYVAQLDGNLEDIRDNIAQLKAQIEEKEEEIALTEQELEAAQAKEDSQKESMTARIRLMYERSGSSMLELLFGAESFSDFLNRADYIELVMEYDHERWQEYIEVRQLVELCREELELEKEILDQAKANVELEESNLEDLIAQKTADLTAYQADINNKAAAIKEYEEMIAAQDAEIEALEAAIAAEKRQLMEQSGISYDGGKFKLPLASYTRVSDDYGWRVHPILKVDQFHNGIDFAAPEGTAIYAAYDGKVVASDYSSTMGNYVMIDHGDSIYTIYMHASALYVSKGDIVVRGETIAAVGTTGRSTGNHLHFGVRKNGEYVSPWNYIS